MHNRQGAVFQSSAEYELRSNNFSPGMSILKSSLLANELRANDKRKSIVASNNVMLEKDRSDYRAPKT